jgi:mevalonate kinase
VIQPAEAHAGGKVILLGEHAVVHGHGAVVAGLAASVRVSVRPRVDGAREMVGESGERYPHLATALQRALAILELPATTGLTVTIGGDLPVAVGLGSSAALSVALLRALASASNRTLSDEQVARGAHLIEKLFHGTPSGVDSTAATFGGLLWFEAGPPPRHLFLRPAQAFEVVIALSGKRHETRATVGGLRERAAASPGVYAPVLRAIGEITDAARSAIESGSLSLLGELMSMNHLLLRALGVSTPELDRATEAALDAGALGAKLTGGGGGGAVVALPAGTAASLAKALRERGYEVLTTPIGTAEDERRRRS